MKEAGWRVNSSGIKYNNICHILGFEFTGMPSPSHCHVMPAPSDATYGKHSFCDAEVRRTRRGGDDLLRGNKAKATLDQEEAQGMREYRVQS